MRSDVVEDENPLSVMRRAKTEICHGGILRTHPVIVVDEQLPGMNSIDRGDDDQFYEEMDEDDDDDDEHNINFDNTRKPSDDNQNVGARPGVIPLTIQLQSRPRCTVCRRFQDGCVRLFRWPRDVKVRRKWCAFFGIDENEVALNLENSYICSWHFDPDQFLYSDHKIYWTPDVCPRHKIRRPANFEPFPWELTSNATNLTNGAPGVENKSGQRKRPKLPPPRATDIFFRQSKYRIAGKTKHPVAVLRLPNDPLFCYEFSYNRTSHIDGTKFYACLQCRKAKAETRVKDYIRTIHLDGTQLLSRGDPFSGHHFACKPIFDAPQHDDDESLLISPRSQDERRERCVYMTTSSVSRSRISGQPMVIEPPQLSPMRPSSEHLAEGTSTRAIRQRNYAERLSRVHEVEDEEYSIINSRFSSDEMRSKTCGSSLDRLAEVFPRSALTSREVGSPLHVVTRESGSTTLHNDISRLHNRRREIANVLSGKLGTERLSYRYILKRRIFNMARSTPVARCYICLRVLRDAAQLVSHLKVHIRKATICRYCGHCDPNAKFTTRQTSRICRRCVAYHREQVPSLNVAHLLATVTVNPQEGVNSNVDESSFSFSVDEKDVNRRTKDQLIVVD